MDAEMHTLLSSPLAWEAPASELLASVQTWILETRPTCLVHPHGFYVLLLKRADGEEWRLHLWPTGRHKISGMPAKIHTHDRHIESRILKGSLTNINYRAEEVNGGGHPLYLVSYLGDKYSHTTINLLEKSTIRLQVEETSRSHLTAGDHYRIERHTLHEAIVPDDQCTLTLVCVHSLETKPVMVIGIDGYPHQLAFERVETDASIYLEQLA